MELHRLSPEQAGARADELAALLIDAVHGGASVTFLPGLSHARAVDYWRGQASAGDGRAMIAAIDGAGVAGFVQVVPVSMENQSHRAEISKLIVHRRARRQGLGRRLILEAEAAARDIGRTHLVLDTAKGDDAERLYASLGWIRAGEIPDYALDPAGRLRTTVLFWKRV